MPLKLHQVRQRFADERLLDIDRTVRDQAFWNALPLRPGARIALGVGSRGIANLAQIVRATVQTLRERGTQPFVVPAMGSHGGATAEGQTELLASFGVTEAAIGCPVRSSMEVVPLPASGAPVELFMDRHAYEADGVLLINRIKPHTDFHGRFESGLVKMAVIGLGKERQAFAIHRHGVRGLREFIPEAAKHLLKLGKIWGGLAVVENAYDETYRIAGVLAEAFFSAEPDLLELARQRMPRLPVSSLDILWVDQIGKNISGSGLDTNVIGRILIRGEPEPTTPSIRSIVLSDLTPESHGNATGIGLADVITQRLHEKVDFAATYKNVITSSFLERGKVPVTAPTDEAAMHIAARAAGVDLDGPARIIRIRDTLHLSELYVSPAVWEELSGRADIERLTSFVPQWDPSGQAHPF